MSGGDGWERESGHWDVGGRGSPGVDVDAVVTVGAREEAGGTGAG